MNVWKQTQFRPQKTDDMSGVRVMGHNNQNKKA